MYYASISKKPLHIHMESSYEFLENREKVNKFKKHAHHNNNNWFFSNVQKLLSERKLTRFRRVTLNTLMHL